ncbi:MAG TPA: DMT family transporter [Usitatibacteraceae bacterium]|nr:DMT family transporter [Usitatibacteraceae bacterium]
MSAADIARLVTLAALWGASYLFMRLSVPHLGAAWVVEGRTLAGGAVLAVFIAATGRAFAIPRHWRGYAVVGVVGVAIPFWLIGTAVKTIDASTAAILNATSPIFSAIIASVWIRERLTVEKIAGIALSITGIAVLVGWTPRPMSAAELLACAMCLSACACYGFTSVFTNVNLKEAPSSAISASSCLVAAAAMAPFTPWTTAASPAPASAWLSVLALGILCTGLAFILYYRLIADLGPVRAVMVTLLIPVFGIFWGVVFLGEPVTPGRLSGCAIVLAGCALALGLLRLPFRSSVGLRGE